MVGRWGGAPLAPPAEDIDVENAVGASIAEQDNTTAVMGTAKLAEGTIIYVPTPTADPQGDLLPLPLLLRRRKPLDSH